MFSEAASPGVSRRVLLVMPVALAGIAALVWRRERPIPDARLEGDGARKKIVLCMDNGKRGETVETNKIVKSDAEWQKELTPEEFAVTRQKGTERAFTGKYWNNHDEGMYRCAC